MKYAIIVVGGLGRVRSPTLMLAINSSPEAHRLTAPVRVSDLPPNSLALYLKLHYGFNLTTGEFGCALAHQAAYKLAHEENLDWALFLEDDAELAPSESLETILSELERMFLTSQGGPVAVQLFDQPTSESDARSNRIRFFQLRGTVAYALNHRAIEQAIATVIDGWPIGKADFPLWATLTTWKWFPRPVFREWSGSRSMVGERPDASSPKRIGHQLTLVLRRLVGIAILWSRFGLGQNLKALVRWEFAEFYFRLEKIGATLRRR